MFFFKNIFNTFLDIILPRYCFNCENLILSEDNYFCSDCYSKLTFFDYGINHKEFKAEEKYCSEIDNFYSLFYFEPESISQKIIHMIKYENKQKLGLFMGEKLGEALLKHDIKADMIIPIPLHKSRKKERGYNQSEIISLGVASVLKIPVITKMLIREKNTISQTKLNRVERKQNVSGAFKITRDLDINNKTIFVLDDVITSGATISECSKLLKSKFNIKIISLSLAYVKDKHDILKIET